MNENFGCCREKRSKPSEQAELIVCLGKLWQFRDKTMDDKQIYISNEDEMEWIRNREKQNREYNKTAKITKPRNYKTANKF